MHLSYTIYAFQGRMQAGFLLDECMHQGRRILAVRITLV